MFRLPQLLIAATIIAIAIPMTHAIADASCDSPTTDAQLLECSSKEYWSADRKLNAAYDKLSMLLDAEGRRKLKDAQQAWIAYRDANAVFLGDLNRDGSAERLNILGAKTRMTETRTKELQSAIEARN